ncbi:hypothetical protein DFH08DRAFT_340469 [Mycena albidolilacea]|uniref:Proteophosphoglycan ppg4 n=1 Tax=Mycena albidolilacea TaxID=1033008 RepID=A0AAD7EIJ9_9AGAR|nr:hypothetical protein DFH08DRAFT_340469 [Mycena albidolilacea]
MRLPISQRNLGNANENPPTGFPASTWIPIAVVISVLTLLSVLVCTRKSIRSRIASMGRGAAVASGTPATRELTAEQLAGSINRAPSAPARRPRRPRRTPSQISTVSLPAYMKEPGEQELVVSRGPDGEDVVMPAAAVEEDDQSNEGHQSSEGHGSSEGHEHQDSNPPDNSRYSPMPHSPHDTPLLGSDPRGDAPAYFEVLDDEQYPPGISIAPPEPEVAAPQRRSGIFSMFRSAPAAPPPIPLPTTSPTQDPTRLSLTHTRTRSTTAPSPIPTRHRASTSTSTLFSLGRKKSSTSLSANNLTSPSLISLASISHPLPHTLIKTEFTALPKSGLTAEQLSLISGTKEGGLGRFGVPWGEAAVAYASASASTSRIALAETGSEEAPPPGWDEVSGLPSSSSEPREGEASGSGSGLPGSGSGSTTQPEAAATPAHEEEAPTAELTPGAALSRADSRASGVSAQTFATAQEGGSDAEDQDDDESDEPQFRMHVQEPTDATTRP